MYDIEQLNLEESFSTNTADLFKNNLEVVELDSLDGVLWNNKVIVELDLFLYDKTKTKSGFELWTDSTYEIGQHTVRSGRMAKLPERLVFWDERNNGMTWKTTIECEVGDRVWFYGLSAYSGEKIICGNKKYVVMDYSDLYCCKKQNGDVVCLNGNVLLKPIMRTQKALSFEKEYVDPDFAIVAYIGQNNTEYESEFMQDDPNLQAGVTVIISGIIPRRLELAPYLEFDGSEYLVAQNYELMGWLDEL